MRVLLFVVVAFVLAAGCQKEVKEIRTPASQDALAQR